MTKAWPSVPGANKNCVLDAHTYAPQTEKLLESFVSMEELDSLYVHTLLQRLITLGYTTGECESGKEF